MMAGVHSGAMAGSRGAVGTEEKCGAPKGSGHFQAGQPLLESLRSLQPPGSQTPLMRVPLPPPQTHLLSPEHPKTAAGPQEWGCPDRLVSPLGREQDKVVAVADLPRGRWWQNLAVNSAFMFSVGAGRRCSEKKTPSLCLNFVSSCPVCWIRAARQTPSLSEGVCSVLWREQTILPGGLASPNGASPAQQDTRTRCRYMRTQPGLLHAQIFCMSKMS